jgi:hypothetical protein
VKTMPFIADVERTGDKEVEGAFKMSAGEF